MKVSLNWIKKFTDIDMPVDELVNKIGAQLGAVEEVINLGKKYEGIVVAKVVKCDKHSDADKLSVCFVDDGGKVKNVERNGDGLVQVVCGAPNVAAGQMVAWIPPGATVPSTIAKAPFVLEAKELRGVISNGMIASAKELDLGDNHDGILVLDDSAKPGEDLAQELELDDYIIDIENKMFTHRPDCFGILGVAREVAGISHKEFKSPDWYETQPPIAEGKGLKLEVTNDVPELVPRFATVAMDGVKVGPSSAKMQSYLARLGVHPVNNVVDATNFIMLLSGQPVHAYDYDKLKTNKLGVRLSKDGEKLNLIGGKELKLKAGAIVITDGQDPVGLGGVMGGADTEVSEGTTKIVLEAATFDMNLTRKTAMAYGLFTDAATRFTKGQSPHQNLAVLHELSRKLQKIAGATPASELIDLKLKLPEPKPVVVVSDFINARLGTKLEPAEMKKLLQNVEFDVSVSQGELIVKAPFWRTDIEIPEDIVEEVGRLYGYDQLAKELPNRRIAPAKVNDLMRFKSQLRDILSGAGASELLCYSFASEKLLRAAGQDPKYSYKIANAISPDFQYYRLSLLPSLLEKVHPNIKLGYDELCLYEIGKVYRRAEKDDDGLPKEMNRVAGVVAQKKADGAAYFDARLMVDYTLNLLGIIAKYSPLDQLDLGGHELAEQMIAPLDPTRSAAVMVDGDLVGVVGEFKQSVSAALKLPDRCAGFELFIKPLAKKSSGTTYQALNRYPSTEQDLCLKTATRLSYGDLTSFIDAQLQEATKDKGYGFSLQPLDIYQKEDSHKQTTWRISLWHPDRTLTTHEVNELLNVIAKAANNQYKAERI